MKNTKHQGESPDAGPVPCQPGARPILANPIADSHTITTTLAEREADAWQAIAAHADALLLRMQAIQANQKK